jgi:hypothetical protein
VKDSLLIRGDATVTVTEQMAVRPPALNLGRDSVPDISSTRRFAVREARLSMLSARSVPAAKENSVTSLPAPSN